MISLGRGFRPTDFQPGDRVRLSQLGIWRLIAWPVRGHLPRGLTRRSTYNRRLTDMSIGTIVGPSHFASCVTVEWDELSTRGTIARRFLTRMEITA